MAAVLLADLVIIAIAHKLTFHDTQRALYLVYWLLGSLAVLSTWNVFWYRRIFRTWAGWLALWPVMFLSSLITQDVIPVHAHPLPLFFILLYLSSAWAIGPASAVLLWHKDAGLRFWAVGSVFAVWVVTLSWQVQGNFFQLIFSIVNTPQTFWWTPAWLCLCFWVLPLGVLAFVGHTLRLVVYEVFRIERCRDSS